MEDVKDYIIVGSGCTGAQAAQTLAEAGVKVTMLDVGHVNETYEDAVPDNDFLSIRKQYRQQHEFMLGKNMEGIPWGKLKVGEHLTPPRQHVVKGVDTWLSTVSDSFTAYESLAQGGLGVAWGCGTYAFSDAELQKAGLDPYRVKAAYETIAKRIGISGANDEAQTYSLGNLKNIQPPVKLETAFNDMYDRYLSQKDWFQRQQIYAGRTPLAVLTQPLKDRRATGYDDMDFWGDNGQSAYRPWITIKQLQQLPNFEYLPKLLVTHFEEDGEYTTVHVIRTDTQQKTSLRCKRLILATGTLGTARIALRSFPEQQQKLHILTDQYCYVPCLNWRMLGNPGDELKSGFSQLSIYYDPDGSHSQVSVASLYTYRSLLLFRLAKEVPLGFKEARKMLHMLQSAWVIAGIHHPELTQENKTIELIQDATSATGDRLKIDYRLSNEEQRENKRREKVFFKALRKLGAFPLKKVCPGHGSSIHYGGTLPFSEQEQPFSISPQGKLHGAKNVFVADGSGFKFIPAKGNTFTLMANAHHVAENVLNSGL